jgi:hypothetical protein
MVRIADTQKETALEALWELMQRKNMTQRPRPKQPTIILLIAVVNWWKGKDYYENLVSSNQQKRDKLLIAVTAWLKRRKKRGTPHRQVDMKQLKEYLKILDELYSTIPVPSPTTSPSSKKSGKNQKVSKKRKSMASSDSSSDSSSSSSSDISSNVSLSSSTTHAQPFKCARPVFTNAKLRGRSVSTLHHQHSINCGHTPVLHTCPGETKPHVDFVVNGSLECGHHEDCCVKLKGSKGTFQVMGRSNKTSRNDGTAMSIDASRSRSRSRSNSNVVPAVFWHTCPGEQYPHVDFMVDGNLECGVHHHISDDILVNDHPNHHHEDSSCSSSNNSDNSCCVRALSPNDAEFHPSDDSFPIDNGNFGGTFKLMDDKEFEEYMTMTSHLNFLSEEK